MVFKLRWFLKVESKEKDSKFWYSGMKFLFFLKILVVWSFGDLLCCLLVVFYFDYIVKCKWFWIEILIKDLVIGNEKWN